MNFTGNNKSFGMTLRKRVRGCFKRGDFDFRRGGNLEKTGAYTEYVRIFFKFLTKYEGNSPLLKQPLRRFSPQLGVALLISIACVHASDYQLYGSRSGALGGANVAFEDQGYGGTLNPASLSYLSDSGKRLTLSWGLAVSYPTFLPISNIIIENSYTSSKTQPTVGSADIKVEPILAHTLGISVPLFADFRKITLGFTGFFPVRQIAYIDTGETYLPEYFLYRTAGQKTQIDVALGGELLPTLRLGAGIHLAYSVTASPTIFLRSNSTRPSSMRLAASVKPKFVPYLGVLWGNPLLGNRKTSFLEGSESNGATPVVLGSVLRFANSSDYVMATRSSAQIFNGLSALDLNFSSNSVLSYDPLIWSTGVALNGLPVPRSKTFLQLDFQAWSHFRPAAISVEDPSQISSCPNSIDCGINISSGKVPNYPYRDIFVPRFGEEIEFGWLTGRLGYVYSPSILRSPSQGAGNYLDPPKHVISIGLGIPFSSFLGYKLNSQFDFHFYYHQLVQQQIVKTPGDETDQPQGGPPDQSSKIGAPGYEAGGKVLGGGFTFSLAL